jgi:hypothetical protein
LNFSQRLFFDGFIEMSIKGRQLLPVRGKESVAGLYKPLFLLILNFWHGDCVSKQRKKRKQRKDQRESRKKQIAKASL